MTAEEVLKKYLDPKIVIVNDPNYTFNMIIGAMEEYASIKYKEKDAEIENLLSVMVAAAEEIQEHWQAHCDEEGYGPANLMLRLEKGIAANYPGYKPGAFTELQNEKERLIEALQFQKQVLDNSKITDLLVGQLEQSTSKIRELLAYLHGDGGHYTNEYGLQKSIDDAIELIGTKWFTKESE